MTGTTTTLQTTTTRSLIGYKKELVNPNDMSKRSFMGTPYKDYFTQLRPRARTFRNHETLRILVAQDRA